MTSDTTDATLALKGLLGIGVVKQSDSNNNSSKGKVDKTKVERNNEIRKIDVKKNPNGKKKKKKKNESTAQKPKKTKSKAQSNQHQPQQQQQGGKKGKKKEPKETSQDQNIKDENFAWSAFQSPPDASALPLPAFGSSFSFGAQDEVQEVNDPAAHTQDAVTSTQGGDRDQSEERGVDLNNLSMEKRTENEIKAMLNIPQNQTHASFTVEEEKTVEQNDSNAQIKSNSSDSDTIRNQKQSDNGVNLASLTISASPEEKSSAPHKEKPFTNNTKKQQAKPDSIDPIAMLMNAQSYGTANPTINNHYQSYNMYSHQMNPHPQMHSPQHQMIPPFLTIQVQVPMHLLPGRRMIVPGSPLTGGYPIPVVVPDGVCPGMYIPVSIPNPASRGGVALQRH